MAVQEVVVPYVHSDYSQWERKQEIRTITKGHTCFQPKYTQITKKKVLKPEPEVDAIITLLQIRISQKRNSLIATNKHRETLQKKNKQLVLSIQHSDAEKSSGVSQSLNRYHRFKGCLSTLKERSEEQLQSACEELAKITTNTQQQTRDLQRLCDKYKKLVETQNERLQTLLSYKEKDYPLKLVQTEQLKAQLEYIDEKHQREEQDLEYALEEERSKFSQTMEATRVRLEAKATEDHLNKMQNSVIALAVHNKVMEKEIMLHEKQSHQMKRDISVLKDKIKLTKTLITENPAHQLRIMALGRCCPETDITLEIDTKSQEDLLV